jgi:hypothetical protein
LNTGSIASRVLAQEARALLTRLARVKPFALFEPMLPAAALSPRAQIGIEQYLARGRRELRRRVRAYLGWLNSPEGRQSAPDELQRRFTFLRLRFNSVLSQFDLFADAITQRSEHETGVWLSGLDVVAADALALPEYYEAPPVICYLDRGPGAAIRRARTRLPGGGDNPVAIVRVPRERMIGSGIGSSLIHEVGHQGAALLDLVESIRPVLKGMQTGGPEQQIVWSLWERWISEIVADFWSVARIGIASTVGLIAVVSLPRTFVFRVSLDDPHPSPWLRVKISCAIGDALYPHPQWGALGRLWESFYPANGLDDPVKRLFAMLEASIPSLVALLVNHRPKSLRGSSLIAAMSVADRTPARLAAYWQAWRASPPRMRRAPPSLAFAVIGQARADARISPETESRLLAHLLTHWALRTSVDTSAAYERQRPCGCNNQCQAHKVNGISISS